MVQQDNPSKGLWTYFVVTYAITALTWGAMAVFQIPGMSVLPDASPAGGGLLLLFLGGFAPSIAGILMTWRVAGRDGLRDLWHRTTRFNLGWTWVATIFLLPLAVLVLRIGAHLASGGTLVAAPQLTQPLGLAVFTLPIILFGPIGEEFGWRGFALDRLLARRHIVGANVILGLLWAFWHLPLFFIPGTIQQVQGNQIVAFPIFALMVMAYSVLISWVYLHTGRSVFSAVLFHLTINWFGSFATTIIDGGTADALVHMATYVACAAVLLVWWSLHETWRPLPA